MADWKGYVQLRRGLYPHLRDMTGSEVKVYCALLILAPFSGERAGEIHVNLRDLADDLDYSPACVGRALHRLSEPHGEKDTRYIDYTPGTNQHTPSKVVIHRFTGSESAVTLSTQQVYSKGGCCNAEYTASIQHTGSDQSKRAPKNVEEDIRMEKKEFSSGKRPKTTRCSEYLDGSCDSLDPECGTPCRAGWTE